MKGWLRRLPRTSEPTQLMFDSTQTLREKPAVDHQSVAEPGSKVFGVFVNHPAVLIEKVGAARNEHLLDAAGIAWMQGDAVGSTWFVHSLHANTPLQALIFQCAMLRLPS